MISATGELMLTEQQIAEFREAFALFDKDGDGHVTKSELFIVFQTLGQKPSDAELENMIAEVDTDGNGQMEFEEFCKLMVKNMAPTEDETTLREAFQMLDTDGGGSISREELFALLQGFSRAGEHLSEEDMESMIAEADIDGDGSISFDEFAKVMMKEAE